MAGSSREGAFRKRVEAAIERDDAHELTDVVLEIALEAEEREWAQACCAQLARHRDANVRGNAVCGLGHLARRFELALWDRSDYVRRQAKSAAEDLATFLQWEFEGPAR
jgi:hypothetical protein